MGLPVLTVALNSEQDVVLARRRARDLAALLGFDTGDQTRISTSVSEIARNAFQYARSGRVDFRIEGATAPQLLLIGVSDRGPGINDLGGVLSGNFVSATGMGLGISGARRLVDQFEIESSPSGTSVVLKKILPHTTGLLTQERLYKVVGDLMRRAPTDAYHELQQQNQELVGTLDEIRKRQNELAQLNAELEDTNRGVVALYAELDEKADHLRRADELKSRFLSNMSHEFRTPLNSILALSGLLLGRTDGDLTGEQELQVSLIRKAAQDLYELVNDLLDLAKVEAGKVVVRPVEFETANLFGALRGMLRPLLVSEHVALVFEDPCEIPPLFTDEGKVSQILRNFLSNALKFTERGEIRVSARLDEASGKVVFRVADTGIGIAKEDHERIFEEFSQVDHPVQKKVRGTGLGLPLARRLAQLLGGEIGVESEPGVGSTFHAAIPIRYREGQPEALPVVEVEPSRIPVLVVEDELETRLIYEKYLKGTPFQLIPARTVHEARELLRRVRPAAIILDILLPGEEAWVFLAELKSSGANSAIPVLIVTSVEDERKGLALGADEYFIKPVDRTRLLARLTELAEAGQERVLVIDDDEIARYVLRRHLGSRLVLEASNGPEGLRLARLYMPSVILLDLSMPGMSGFEVLDELKSAPATAQIPVIVVTSKSLTAPETGRLAGKAEAVLSKNELSLETITSVLSRVVSATKLC